MLSAPGRVNLGRGTHAHKFMPPFGIPIFLCAAQHRAFLRNLALYPTPNNAEPEPMHIDPQCPVPYLVILYSVQSPVSCCSCPREREGWQHKLEGARALFWVSRSASSKQSTAPRNGVMDTPHA